MHDPLHLARRAERGVRAVGCRPRQLDVRVRVRLVVVHEDQAVVVGMGKRRRNGAHAHVGAAAVAAEGDDVDRLVLHLALAHEHLEGCRRAERRRAGRPELRVHPRDDPRRAVVRRVRDVHAPCAPQDDGARACRFHHQLHHQSRLAALASPVSGGEELLERKLLHALERIQLLRAPEVRQFRQLPIGGRHLQVSLRTIR